MYMCQHAYNTFWMGQTKNYKQKKFIVRTWKKNIWENYENWWRKLFMKKKLFMSYNFFSESSRRSNGTIQKSFGMTETVDIFMYHKSCISQKSNKKMVNGGLK